MMRKGKIHLYVLQYANNMK